MSYSIMSPFRDEKAKNKMLKFLNINYRPLNKILPNLEDNYLDGPTIELNYHPKENIEIIGFNYGSGFSYNEFYAFRICYWMSLMEGNKKDIEIEGVIYKDCSYVIYDGCEEWPLFVGFKSPSNEFVLVDEYGFKPIRELNKNFITSLIFKKENKKIQKIDDLIRRELIRLTELYKKDNL